MKNKKILNMVLITAAYLISTTFSLAFLYGLLFYNRIQTNSDPASWAILFSCFLFPGAIINIPVGAMSDTYSKRKLMLISELFGGLLVLIFSFLFSNGYSTTIYLGIYLSFLSLTFAFFEVPLDASLINICDEELAKKLVSIIWMSRAIANSTGPLIGHYMSSSYSMMKLLFIINAISFIISALLQYRISFNEAEVSKKDRSVLKTVSLQIKTLSSYIKENRIIGFLFTLNLIIAAFYLPLFGAIAPAMSSSLNLGDVTLAYIESFNWIGVVISALVVTIFSSGSFYLKNLFNFITIQGIFLLAWLFPLLGIVSTSKMALVFILLSTIDGIINTFQSLGALTFFQINIPENVRGSLLGTMRTVMKISAPIGIAMYGFALKFVDWHITMLATSLIVLFLGIFLRRVKIYSEFIKKI